MFRDVWVILTKPSSHHKPLFVGKECNAVAISCPSQHDVTSPGWQNVRMKMSNYSTLLLEVFQVKKKKKATVERSQSLAAEDGALYHGSARQIWSGGCKKFVQPVSPEIAGFSDTGKSFPCNIIIGRVVPNHFFPAMIEYSLKKHMNGFG